MRIQRSHGALAGFLLLVLGAWGGMIAFVGPYFHYAFTPDATWTYNTQRLWLEILPGAAAFIGGVLVLISAHRLEALAGACLAALAGVWFALGTVFAPLWHPGSPAGGLPTGSTTTIRVLEQLGFFTGLGVAIALIAGFAIGRLTAVSSARPEPAAAPAATPKEAKEAKTVATDIPSAI